MVTPGYLAFHPNPKKPDHALPPNACDAHCHVFGPVSRFPFAASSTYVPVDAPKETLFERHRHLGVTRAVIVQASCHGTDNTAMLDALRAGGDDYRGIAVVPGDITERALEEMHHAGVRGVRFNFVKRLGGGRPLNVYRTILDRVGPLGWHVVVYFDAEDLKELAPFLRGIAVPVVIDHMGRVPVEQGLGSEPFRLLRDLLSGDEKFRVKVSCPERLSRAGPTPLVRRRPHRPGAAANRTGSGALGHRLAASEHEVPHAGRRCPGGPDHDHLRHPRPSPAGARGQPRRLYWAD